MTDNIKYELEFLVNVSPAMLFQYISTPSGLSEWYADNVSFENDIFEFVWEDEDPQKAKISIKKPNEKIRFKWLDDEEIETDLYFEFRIEQDELTKDVSLVIIDFAKKEEIEDIKQLWESQITDLKHILGAT